MKRTPCSSTRRVFSFCIHDAKRGGGKITQRGTELCPKRRLFYTKDNYICVDIPHSSPNQGQNSSAQKGKLRVQNLNEQQAENIDLCNKVGVSNKRMEEHCSDTTVKFRCADFQTALDAREQGDAERTAHSVVRRTCARNFDFAFDSADTSSIVERDRATSGSDAERVGCGLTFGTSDDGTEESAEQECATMISGDASDISDVSFDTSYLDDLSKVWSVINEPLDKGNNE